MAVILEEQGNLSLVESDDGLTVHYNLSAEDKADLIFADNVDGINGFWAPLFSCAITGKLYLWEGGETQLDKLWLSSRSLRIVRIWEQAERKERNMGKQFVVEYRLPCGEIKRQTVEAIDVDDAMDGAVELLGIDYNSIQTVEERG